MSNLTVYVLIALVIGFGIAQFMFGRKPDELTAEKWERGRVIIYDTIDACWGLYEAGRLGGEYIITEAVSIAREKIVASGLPDADKNYWNEDKLRIFIAPVVNGMIARLSGD